MRSFDKQRHPRQTAWRAGVDVGWFVWRPRWRGNFLEFTLENTTIQLYYYGVQLFGCAADLNKGGVVKKVSCEYFVTDSKRVPAREFIDSLDPKTQRKFFFVVGLLEEFGHRLPQPHAKYMGDEIFELRFKGREGAIRVLYFFFHQDRAIFTNGFIKKTDKTPKNEKEIAVQRRMLFLERAGKQK